MEGAMAATLGASRDSSCLQFRRKTEMLCSTSTTTIAHVCGSSSVELAYCANKNKSQKLKSKPPGGGSNFVLDKKKIRLLDGLCKDLSALSNGAPPADGDGLSLADQVGGRILPVAQAKAERKERKRLLKAQKKRALKPRKGAEEEAFETPQRHLEFGRSAKRVGVSQVVADQQHSGDKIEVCVGPKCRKLGSDQLLEAFQERGVEAVGCKCLGKCRSAPNVRVCKLRSNGGDASRQLHLGVDVGDVDFIVSQHFGEEEDMQEHL